jgi:hypothetical protein
MSPDSHQLALGCVDNPKGYEVISSFVEKNERRVRVISVTSLLTLV